MMDEDDVRGQLAAHRLTTPRQCLCGERQDGEWSDDWHAEHVTDELLPMVSRIADQAAAEALDAMAVAFYADARHLVSSGEEAYRHAADDCRAEATRLAPPTEVQP